MRFDDVASTICLALPDNSPSLSPASTTGVDPSGPSITGVGGSGDIDVDHAAAGRELAAPEVDAAVAALGEQLIQPSGLVPRRRVIENRPGSEYDFIPVRSG